MALVDSNTYIEPTAGTSLNAARTQLNNSLRSLLSNFYSSATPISVNLTASGAPIGVQDGMLYRNSTNKALYIADSINVKTSRVGGTFTRVGIGNRIENGIAALTANVASYEIGELVATVSASPGIAGNARLYLSMANNSTMADMIDVGIPPTNGSIVNTMIAIGGVTGDRISYRYFTSDGNSGANAHLKITTTIGNNTALALGTSNTVSNVSLVKMDGIHGQGIKSGINVMDQTGKQYAPLAANIISQASIQGTSINVAPLIPAGTITAWSGATAPTGWILADGAEINRTTYSELFAICGTTFGVGDGATTFLIPNLSGRTVVGVSANSTRGYKSAAVSTDGAVTTSSSITGISLVLGGASTGIKDAGGIAVGVSVTDPGHTHASIMPFTGLYYIIKT
jgi:hypothetical protein